MTAWCLWVQKFKILKTQKKIFFQVKHYATEFYEDEKFKGSKTDVLTTIILFIIKHKIKKATNLVLASYVVFAFHLCQLSL